MAQRVDLEVDGLGEVRRLRGKSALAVSLNPSAGRSCRLGETGVCLALELEHRPRSAVAVDYVTHVHFLCLHFISFC